MGGWNRLPNLNPRFPSAKPALEPRHRLASSLSPPPGVECQAGGGQRARRAVAVLSQRRLRLLAEQVGDKIAANIGVGARCGSVRSRGMVGDGNGAMVASAPPSIAARS